MTNEQILEKQVEALEKLLQLRSAIIEELETKVATLQQEIITKNHAIAWPGVTVTPYVYPYPGFGGGVGGTITIGNPTCPDGSPHQYPSMWGGTNPPSCSKCGAYQQGMSGTTTTVISGGGISPNVGQGSNIGPISVPNAAPYTLNGIPVHTTGYMQPVDPGNTNNVFTLTNVAK